MAWNWSINLIFVKSVKPNTCYLTIAKHDFTISRQKTPHCSTTTWSTSIPLCRSASSCPCPPNIRRLWISYGFVGKTGKYRTCIASLIWLYRLFTVWGERERKCIFSSNVLGTVPTNQILQLFQIINSNWPILICIK